MKTRTALIVLAAGFVVLVLMAVFSMIAATAPEGTTVAELTDYTIRVLFSLPTIIILSFLVYASSGLVPDSQITTDITSMLLFVVPLIGGVAWIVVYLIRNRRK